MEIEFHPIANVFPLIEGREFDELVADIKAHGLLEPIIVYDHKILDGRNRYRACLAAGVEPDLHIHGRAEDHVLHEGHEETTWAWFDDSMEIGGPWRGDIEDPHGLVLSLNLLRRHQDEGSRAVSAAKLANLPRGRPSGNTSRDVITQTQAAEMLNVSVPSVQRATVVLDHGVTELQDKVAKGGFSLKAAADIARLPKEEQREVVQLTDKEILERAKEIRQERAVERQQQNAEIRARQIELPNGLFDVIVIDPPWPMEKIERDIRPNQSRDLDYPIMQEAELAALTIPADEHCHVWLWTTHRFLPMAFRLFEAWQLRYVCSFVWHKPGGFQPIGLPQYNCEFALYARRGSPTFTSTKGFPACFEAPRGEHSEKPEQFYEILRRVTEGRRLDMFNRRVIDGFTGWGKEAEAVD